MILSASNTPAGRALGIVLAAAPILALSAYGCGSGSSPAEGAGAPGASGGATGAIANPRAGTGQNAAAGAGVSTAGASGVATANGGKSASAGAGNTAGNGSGASGTGAAGGGSAAPGDPKTWRSVVIQGGGYLPGILYHPGQPGLAYARTDMGGAYRWDATSRLWSPILDSLGRDAAHLMGVLSMAIDPQDPKRVYALSGKYTGEWDSVGALMASEDQGKSWRRVDLTAKIGGNEVGRGAGERLVVDPNQGSRLFMGTTKNGLFKSSDSGATWSPVTGTGLTATSNINFVLFDPSTGAVGAATQRILVSTTDRTGNSLIRSEDGGATWSPVPNQPTGVMAFRGALQGTRLYLTFSSSAGPNDSSATGSVWRVDLGAGDWVWKEISPAKAAYAFAGVSVDPKDANQVVVSSLFHWDAEEIYHSTTGGDDWKPLLATATWDSTQAPYVKNDKPHWITDVKLDPSDPSQLMFVTGYGLWLCKGVPAQVVCAFEDAGIEELVPLQIISPPSGARLLSVVGDRDGFRHDDLTVSPARFSPNVGTTRALAFAEAVPEKLVKVYDKTPFGAYSKDSGSTWTAFSGVPTSAASCDGWHCSDKSIALSADGKTVVWGMVNAAVSYSTDDGASWKPSAGITITNPIIPPRPVADRVNPMKFYAFDCMAGAVWSSTDGGASFTKSASALPVSVGDWAFGNFELAAVFGQEGNLWLAAGDSATATGGSGLFRSKDSGVTFQKVAGVTNAYNVGFGQAAPGASYPAVYIWGTVGSVTGIFRSDDEGATWKRINDDQHQFGSLHAVIGDPREYGRVYIATEGRGILYANP